MYRSFVAAALAIGLLTVAPSAWAVPAPYRIAATVSSEQDKELLVAVFKADVERVQAALDAGASVNARFSGETISEEEALDYGVVMMEDIPAFTQLTYANEARMTALLVAIRNESLEIVQLLLARRADPNMLSGDRRVGPLMQATVLKNRAIAMALMEAGADVNLRNSAGWAPLTLAIQYDSPDLAMVYLDRGAQVKDLKVRTLPLVAGAIAHGMVDLAAVLIDRGADIRPRVCMTLAIEKGSLPLVKKLVQGTDWDATEVKLAKDKRQPEIEAYLRAELAKRRP